MFDIYQNLMKRFRDRMKIRNIVTFKEKMTKRLFLLTLFRNFMNSDFLRNSRVMLTIGMSTFEKLSKYNVAIVGLSSVGTEIIKNLLLMNVASITVYDDQKVTIKDVGSNFFARDADIGNFRTQTIINRVKDLNSQCKIVNYERLPDNSELEQYYSVIISIPISYNTLIDYSEYCYEHNIMFMCAAALGPTALMFESFTSNFIVTNPKGKQPFKHAIKSLSNSKNSTVYLRDEEAVLQPGQKIRFENVEALPALNSLEVTLQANKNKNIKECCTGINLKEIGNWDSSKSAGFICEVFNPIEIHHKSLKNALEIEIDDNFVRNNFIEVCKSNSNEYFEYPPIAAAIGAIAAHHTIMFCTQIYVPLQKQWFIIDHRRSLSTTKSVLQGNRYDSIISVIGNEAFSKIRNSTLLMIGAGAIGCEYARNLALLGPKKIIIFDNDKIEPSNLTRQFLYKQTSEGMYKADVAAEAIRSVNSEIIVESHVEYFNDKSCRKLDLSEISAILSGVDTVSGRKFASTLARLLKVPFINCGSEGASADGQVIVHDKTGLFEANYESEDDKPVISCTLRANPTSPVHCVQLYKLQFDDEFTKMPTFAMNSAFIGNNEENVYKFIKEIPKDFIGCANWARKYFEKENVWMISDQFKNNTSVYDPNDVNNANIIKYGAILKAKLHNIKIDEEKIQNLPFLVPLKLEEIHQPKEIHSNKEWHDMRMAASDNLELHPFEYDKDDMTMLSFIHAMSNVHAKVYHLQEISLLDTLKISGNVAATISTTGTVVGSLCIALLVETFSGKLEKEFEEKKKVLMNFNVDLQNDQKIIYHCSVPNIRLSKGVYANPWESVIIDDNPIILDLIDSIEEKYKTECLSVKLEYDGKDFNFNEEDLEKPINDVIISNIGKPILGLIPLIPILGYGASKTPLFLVKID